MDAEASLRHLNDATWRRWTLLMALLALGCMYILAYALFVRLSKDFVVAKRNREASEYSLGHLIDTPANLPIGLGKSDVARLGGGWHIPEADGVWTETNDAWIDLVVRKEADSDLLLRLNTTAFVAKRHPSIGVFLSVNEIQIASWKLDSTNNSQPLEVRIPRSLIRTGRLFIHLRIDHSMSPTDAHAGRDRRQLGVYLSSIEMREVQ